MIDYDLPGLPGGYYWKVRERDDGYTSELFLDLMKHRKWGWDKFVDCERIKWDVWRTPQRSIDEILDIAELIRQRHLLGPLTPITGYKFEGASY